MPVTSGEEEFFVLPHASNEAHSIVYAPLRSYLAVIPAHVASALTCKEPTNLKRSLLSLLASKPKISPQRILEDLHSAPPELSLAITDDCNLRCVYCHASAGSEHKRRSMSIPMIGAVLDAYFRFASEQRGFTINFNGGGEPTFAFKELQFAVRHAKKKAAQREQSVSFAMATNGCYGNKIREFIVENFRSVSLSFDGPAHIQDRHRPRPSGKGSFRQVLATAEYFRDARFPFAFRATVSNYSLPYLTDLVDLVASEFPGRSLALEHLNPFGRGADSNHDDLAPPNKLEFAHRIADLIQYARALGVEIVNSASTEFDLVRPVFCSNVGIPNWTVSTSGNIVACGRDNVPDQFIFGHFDESAGEVVLDAEKIRNLHSLNVMEYDECTQCFSKYHCAGDCPDRRLADKSDCNAIRHIALRVLSDIADGAPNTKERANGSTSQPRSKL